MAESQDWGGVGPSNMRRTTMEERETGVRAVTQRDKTQELCAGRTSTGIKNTFKLGNQGLIKETLAAPSQGIHPPFLLSLTTGATLGPYED